MKIIFHWLVVSAAVYGLAYFMPAIAVNPWWIALLVGAVLYFINSIVKPVIKILTLPINIITFGLFSIALNVFFFWFPSTFIDGFQVVGLKAAFIGAIVIALISWMFDKAQG
jgi:putative membrane protein